MALKTQIGARQRQRLALSPHMRQSIGILQLSTQALSEAIAQEADENPFLIVAPARDKASAYDVALATVAARESLSERLAAQVAMQKVAPVTKAAAQFLIGELREDGYLDEPLDAIAGRTGLPEGVLADGLAALQCCEPAGIAARSLGECLALQLVDAGVGRDLADAAVRHLEDFAQGRWERLVERLGADPSAVERVAALLPRLRSSPVSDEDEWVQVTTPELLIEQTPQGGLDVSLLQSAVPGISTMDVGRDTLATAELRNMFDRAQRFTTGLAARAETLMRIGHYIATEQAQFFLGGHSSIAPVTRADAASALAMHPSTLGRALAGKAVLADKRLYPLSLFFTRALPGPDGAISPFDIQRRIREMIGAEAAEAPLADEEIRTQLYKEGVDIARRTVAKYRKCMRIPSSFGRRHRKGSEQDQPRGTLKAK